MTLLFDTNPRARQDLAQRRGRVEVLLELGQALPTADRALLEQVFRRGASAAEVARLAGQPPHKVRRRLRLILRRLRNPLFNLALQHLDLLPPPARPTVRLVLFHGLSLRRAARRRGKSLHEVRTHMLALEALAPQR